MKHLLLNRRIPGLTNYPIFARGVGIDFDQDAVDRPEGFPYHQLLFSARGVGTFHVAGKTHHLGPNRGIFLPSHTPHSYHRATANWATHWLVFDGTLCGTLFRQLGLSDETTFDVLRDWDVVGILHDVYSRLTETTETNHRRNSTEAYRLVITLRDHLHTPKARPAPFQRLLEDMQHSPEGDFGMTTLSRRLSLTPQYICRLFRNNVGLRPGEFLLQCRMERAKEMLVASPSLSVKEICYAVGYRDTSYFIRRFRAYQKMTPGEFRKTFFMG